MSIGAHHSPKSQSVDWLTPPEWLRALGSFDVDPACPESMPWITAATMYTPLNDGLAQPWRGRVWLNPPYGAPRVIEPWMKRMAKHNNGIALIFARTETQCWFRYVWPVATGVLFVQGRPHFYTLRGQRAQGNSGAPVALIAYGEANLTSLSCSGIRGKLILANQTSPKAIGAT